MRGNASIKWPGYLTEVSYLVLRTAPGVPGCTTKPLRHTKKSRSCVANSGPCLFPHANVRNCLLSKRIAANKELKYE